MPMIIDIIPRLLGQEWSFYKAAWCGQIGLYNYHVVDIVLKGLSYFSEN